MMKVLDIFSWLPASEMSLEQIEEIFLQHVSNICIEDEYKVLVERPKDANQNIINSSQELYEEGKDVCYLLRKKEIIAVIGYKKYS